MAQNCAAFHASRFTIHAVSPVDIVDFILNLAGLLLWLNWWSARHDPLAQAKASTLAGTLKRAKAPIGRRWIFLTAAVALIPIRAWCYWKLGPALNWTPTLEFGVTVVPFRSDHLTRMMVFSLLSFGHMLAVFYVAVVFLVIVNRRLADTDPVQKLVRLYLGRLARWPSPLLALLVVLAGVGSWMAIHPLLASLGIAPQAQRSAQAFQQGLLVTVRDLLALRYLIAALLLAHLLNSYVYLGSHAIWGFVNETGRHLLAPLRWLPLRIGRVDFAPVLEIILVFLLAELALRYLPKLNPL